MKKIMLEKKMFYLSPIPFIILTIKQLFDTLYIFHMKDILNKNGKKK